MSKPSQVIEKRIPGPQLCDDFHCSPKTLRKRAKELGLKLEKAGRVNLFTVTQVRALEEYFKRRAQTKEIPDSPQATVTPRDAGDALRGARARASRRLANSIRLTPRSPDAVVVAADFSGRK